MNIGIIKIGQKIIFNRDSLECNRSNTNGNVGTYLLCKALIESNFSDKFVFLSPNDLESNAYKNVCTFVDDIDFIVVFAGLKEYEKDPGIYDFINNNKYMLLADDPRCLLDTLSNENITNKPSCILSQFDGKLFLNNDFYDVKYFPLEKIYCNLCEFDFKKKKNNNLIVISNTSSDDYRINVISRILKFINVKVYGRLNEQEIGKIGKDKYAGEINFYEMQNKIKDSKCSLIVPIKRGVVTSKYIELLNGNCVPIFYKDYNTKFIKFKPVIKVKNAFELFIVCLIIKILPQSIINIYLENFRKVEVYPYNNLFYIGRKMKKYLERYA